MDSHGGNCHISVRKRMAFPLPVAPQQARWAGNLRCHRQAYQSAQKSGRASLLAGPKTSIHFGYVHWAASQHEPLLDELDEQLRAAKPPLEQIKNDG